MRLLSRSTRTIATPTDDREWFTALVETQVGVEVGSLYCLDGSGHRHTFGRRAGPLLPGDEAASGAHDVDGEVNLTLHAQGADPAGSEALFHLSSLKLPAREVRYRERALRRNSRPQGGPHALAVRRALLHDAAPAQRHTVRAAPRRRRAYGHDGRRNGGTANER